MRDTRARSRGSKSVRQAAANLLAEHCSAEDMPSFDETDEQVQPEPGEKDRQTQAHGGMAQVQWHPSEQQFLWVSQAIEVPSELRAARVVTATATATDAITIAMVAEVLIAANRVDYRSVYRAS